MITLYLVRHGETIWNKIGRYQGSTDVELNENGREQAKKAAQWFKNVHLDSIISSPLRRAVYTAEEIAKIQKCSVETDSGIRELSFGDWEGLTYTEIEERWPGMIEDMYHDASKLKLPHGETFEECQRRCMKSIKELIARGDNKSYAIVCHGAALRTIICGMLNIPLNLSWNFALSNASISVLHIYPGDMNILYTLNSTDHLK